jgi:hypothetical protein
MSVFGELERFFSEVVYPVWPLFLALAVIGIAVAGYVSYRLGWHLIALRHRLITATALVLFLAAAVPAGYYTISPLFERNTVCEASPIAGAGAGSEQCEVDPNTVSVVEGDDASVEPDPTSTPDAPADDPDATVEPDPTSTTAAPADDPDAPLEPDPTSTAAAPTDDADAPLEPDPTSTPDPTPFQAQVVEQGEFEGADSFHFGEGTALLIETGPSAYTLRFEDFSVRNGPDLFVYLSPAPDGYADGALELGTLKGTDGAFNYEIPPGTDVSQFKSAVVWCKAFSVLFATATFA